MHDVRARASTCATPDRRKSLLNYKFPGNMHNNAFRYGLRLFNAAQIAPRARQIAQRRTTQSAP
eukprot:11224302-Lingulodinium_polyedra.AAC.1